MAFLPALKCSVQDLDNIPERLPNLKRGQWIINAFGVKGRFVGVNKKSGVVWIAWDRQASNNNRFKIICEFFDKIVH